MSQLEEIRAEAVKILRIVGRLRKAEAEAAKERGEPTFKFVSAAELLSEPLPVKGQPKI